MQVIVVVWIIVWLIVGVSLISVFAETPDFPRNFEIICEIIKKEPFYNCNEKWIIIFVDQITIQDPLTNWVLGYAVHDKYIINNEMSICNFYPGFREMGLQYCDMEWIGIGSYDNDGCYSGRCLTPLQHEIKHLQCDCDWHKGSWTSKRMVITITGNV